MTGTPTGQWAMTDTLVTRISPWQSDTSVDVPPISKVRIASYPAARATSHAPTTPPAGPLRMVRTGSRADTRAEMLPPFDCMTRRLVALGPLARDWIRFCNAPRYRPITGAR